MSIRPGHVRSTGLRLTGGYDEEEEGEGVKDVGHVARLLLGDSLGRSLLRAMMRDF